MRILLIILFQLTELCFSSATLAFVSSHIHSGKSDVLVHSDTTNNLINILTEGAKPDYNTISKTGSNNIEAFQKAINKGSIYIPKGLYYFDIKNPEESIIIPSNRTLVFEKGATIIFGMKDIYFPAFVIINSHNVSFKNPSFIWIGKLTFGPGMDNLDSFELSQDSKRYNTKYAYSNRHYCAAIWCAESRNIHINNFHGESFSKNGNSVIYNWIHAVRVDRLFIDKCDMNDMLLGVMSQGGNGGKISNITADRMSQDIGIPGHVIYSFRRNCPIDSVTDSGTETSLTGKRISHTVSIKNRSDVSNIFSRRSEGVLNVGVDSSINVTNINWKENIKFPSTSKTPKLYLITSAKNYGIIGRNINLEGLSNNVCELFGGKSDNSSFKNVTLIRNDSISNPNFGFLTLKGNQNYLQAKLLEHGNFTADIVKNFNGSSNENNFDLELVDFKSDPVINVNTGAVNNTFKIRNLNRFGIKKVKSSSPPNIFNGSRNSNKVEYLNK